MSLVSTVLEKRLHRRLELELPVEFRPDGFQDSVMPRTGLTRNVSAGGIYFETSMGGTVTYGSEMLLKIAIPRPDVGSGETFSLRCEGHVVRIDKVTREDSGREFMGIAVQFRNKPNVECLSLNRLLWELGR